MSRQNAADFGASKNNMKPGLLFASLLLAFSMGCSQQQASTSNNSQDANSNAVHADPESQAKAHDNGVKAGEKARELEERTRPERQKLAAETATAAEKLKEESIKLDERATAAAHGVKQGWEKRSAQGGNAQVVDINSADTRELQSLPGITIRKAQMIISARPYSSPQELVSKRAITQADYARIKDKVTASQK